MGVEGGIGAYVIGLEVGVDVGGVVPCFAGGYSGKHCTAGAVVL